MEAIRNTVGGVQCEQIGAIFPHLLKPQVGLLLLLLPPLLLLLLLLFLLLLLLLMLLLLLVFLLLLHLHVSLLPHILL